MAENQKTCVDCGCEAAPTYRICRHCGSKVSKETVELPELNLNDLIDPYHSFSEFEVNLPNINCKVGEPDFENPNSYDAIIQVIQNIGVNAGIKQYGGEREWLLIECDGVPYNMLREIIAKVWRCIKCNCCYFQRVNYDEHRCYILYKTEPFREFGWIVPVMGLLHLEMNTCRSFVKLNWEVFTRTLGNVLGFQTPKAAEYLRKGSDHHKTWHFLEILYTSLSLELVVPYVKDASLKQIGCTLEGYWEWTDQVMDPNYIYLQHAVFTHLHALMMLRSSKPLFSNLIVD